MPMPISHQHKWCQCRLLFQYSTRVTESQSILETSRPGHLLGLDSSHHFSMRSTSTSLRLCLAHSAIHKPDLSSSHFSLPQWLKVLLDYHWRFWRALIHLWLPQRLSTLSSNLHSHPLRLLLLFRGCGWEFMLSPCSDFSPFSVTLSLILTMCAWIPKQKWPS